MTQSMLKHFLFILDQKSCKVFLLIVSYIPPTKADQLSKLLETVQNAEEKYKNVICTGDFNSKSYFWGNMDKNAEGIILENFIMNTDFICVNDGAPTRRNASSVIDLFLVKPQVYRKIKCCTTLTHECVRSDHIPVMLDIEDEIIEESVEEERYLVNKTNWVKWKEMTEEKFSERNDNHGHDDLETMYNSFIEVLVGCIEDCVPKKMLKLSDKKSNPHWMNEEVKAKRTELNRSKKMFKRRGTPNNLEKLKELEESFFVECDEAKSRWIDETCKKIEMHTRPKDRWREFKKLTSYNREQADVLPLLDEGKPVFSTEEKCKLMKNVFFWW